MGSRPGVRRYDRFGFPVVMTQPAGVNGADLLPLSVIGCAAWDLVSILRKQRQPLLGLQITATSQRDSDAPWRFRRIHIHYLFAGYRLAEAQLRHAIDLTKTKYCSTLATVGGAVALTSDFEIAKESNAMEPMTRTPAPSEASVSLVTAFNDALNAGDVDGMLQRMTDDCIFENTYPAPDGTRYVGQAAVRAFWQAFFASAREWRIEVEEIFGCGDRCTMRWTYGWVDSAGQPGHVRGIDLYRVRDGLIAEKLSYVKG